MWRGRLQGGRNVICGNYNFEYICIRTKTRLNVEFNFITTEICKWREIEPVYIITPKSRMVWYGTFKVKWRGPLVSVHCMCVSSYEYIVMRIICLIRLEARAWNCKCFSDQITNRFTRTNYIYDAFSSCHLLRRSWVKTWKKRTRCSLNFALNSIRKM